MTEFVDGPAQGQKLLLRRAPVFLRVALNREGKWDALDGRSDTPRLGEVMTVYRLIECSGHICVRGNRNGPNGCFKIATYRVHDRQPELAILWSSVKWPAWAEYECERIKSEKDAAEKKAE